MARPNPAARDAVIEATQRLMVAKGYAATTVEQICQEAATTKGTFFHYFSTKEEVARVALERFSEGQRAALGSGPYASEPDPLKRFDGFIDFAAKFVKDPIRDSCLVGMLSHELSDTHPEFRALCRAALGRLAGDLKGMIDAVKAKYAPTKQVDTQGLADLFVTLSQGGFLVAKAKGSPAPMREALRHYQAYVHSALGIEGSSTRRPKRASRTLE
jgi:TetR/AcrR family transcriptional regulator, transcriptional repressor for nem operon